MNEIAMWISSHLGDVASTVTILAGVIATARWVIHSLRKEFDMKFDKMDRQIQKMQESITDIDRRVCRIEGALQNRECCLLKDDHRKTNAS